MTCSLSSPAARSQLPSPGTVFGACCWVFSFLPSPWFLLSLLCWILLLPQVPSLLLMGSLLTLLSYGACSPIAFQNHVAVNPVDIVGTLLLSNFYLLPDLPHQLHPHRSVCPLTSPLPYWVAISNPSEPKFKPLSTPATCTSHTLPHSSNAGFYPTSCSGQNPSRPCSTSKSCWLCLQILLFPESNHLSPSTCVRPCTAAHHHPGDRGIL